MRRGLWLALLVVLLASTAWAQPSLLGDVVAERAKYGAAITHEQVAQVLNTVAARNPGWGLLSKPAGANCPAPQGRVACDILVYGPTGTHFDVFADVENEARPVWQDKGPIDMARFLAPVVSGGTPAPAPPIYVPPSAPPQAPVAVDLSGLYQRLSDLYAQQERIHAAREAEYRSLAAQLEAHDERLKKHDEEPGWLTRRLRSGSTYAVIGTALAAWFGRDVAQ